jgi:hypothetical protein
VQLWHGICQFWYWKIAAFVAMNFTIGLARILFGVITGHIQLSDN